MDSEIERRAGEIFLAALAKDPSQREEFIRFACSSDESVRAAVDGLLAAAATITQSEQLHSPDEPPPAPAVRESELIEDARRAAELLPQQAEPTIGEPNWLLQSWASESSQGEGQSGVVGGSSVQEAPWMELPGNPVIPLTQGQLESRYELIEEVGRGGMGAVYRARQRNLDRKVAIKVGLPKSSADRFVREAMLLAQIDSPYVVKAYDFGRLSNLTPVLVMEWVEGIDLLKKIQGTQRATGRPLREDIVLPWMVHTCQALLAAHERGIIHRDLKPSNILIDRKGRARVADFGLARTTLTVSELSMSGSAMGTPLYMAPEQAEDARGVDTRADVYSFGATFYHALTGRPPFEGPTAFSVLYKHKTEPLVPPRSLNPKLSRRISEVLERCLAKSAQDRFPSFAPILEGLSHRFVGSSPWEAWEDPVLSRYLERYESERVSYFQRESLDSSFEFPEGRRLRILKGDITRQEVDAIVSSDDEWLSMSGGVSAAIHDVAGPAVVTEARCYIPVRLGRAVVTSAGNLPCRFVIHGITLKGWPHESEPTTRAVIAEVIASCFYHADTLRLQSIALPLLGTGMAEYPRDVCLDITFQVVARNLLYGLSSVKEVRIVLRD